MYTKNKFIMFVIFLDIIINLFLIVNAKADSNPAIAYVQSAKETNFGNFGGVLDESFHNPCGLKKAATGSDTDKNAHKMFNTWDEGIEAHLDHLALYTGADEYPRDNTYDYRHFQTLKGTASTVELLGGKWASSSAYGDEVNLIINIGKGYNEYCFYF